MNPKMNRHSWNWLKSMHNTIDSSIIIYDAMRRNMTKFASKQISGWSQCYQTYDWNISAHCTKRFHYESQNAQSFHNDLEHNANDPSNEPSKSFLILVVITLHQTWPPHFLSMLCIWEGLWTFGSNADSLNKTSPSKSNWQELDFVKRCLVIMQIL